MGNHGVQPGTEPDIDKAIVRAKTPSAKRADVVARLQQLTVVAYVRCHLQLLTLRFRLVLQGDPGRHPVRSCAGGTDRVFNFLWCTWRLLVQRLGSTKPATEAPKCQVTMDRRGS